MMSSSCPTVSDSSRTCLARAVTSCSVDDESILARQRRDADLERAIRDGRRDRVAGRRGDLQRDVAPDELVQPPLLALLADERGEARVRQHDPGPSVLGLDDGRRHGGVLEREAAQVVARWRQRAHG